MRDEFDDYLDQNKGADEFDAYLSEQAPKPAGPKTSAGESALESYGNAMTLGYLPHIQAATQPAFDKVMDLVTGNNVSDQDNGDYLSRRDENLKRQALQKKEHPIASGVGTAAGIVGSALVPVGAAAKGATLGAKALKGLKVGAGMGAIANPGDTENEISPLQPWERAKNAAAGAAIGAILPGAIDKGVSAGQKVAAFLREKAARKATRSLGRPTPTQAERMAKTGQDVELGRQLLDDGAIPILGTPGRIQKRVGGLKEKAGEEIGDLLESGGSAKLVDSEKLAIEILDSPEIAQMRMTPGMESTVAQIEKQVETLAKNGQLTLKEAQKLRQGIDKSINFNKSAPDMRGAQEGLYKQRTALRDAMNEGVNSLPNASGKDALIKANRKYGNLETASDILEREVGRNQANRAISLTDTIAAAAGASTGNPLTAAALGAVNKFGRTFGNSIQARGYDATSKGLASAASGLSKANPQVARSIAQRLGLDLSNDFEKDDTPILNNPQLMDLFKKDPGLVDSIADEGVRAKVKRAIASKR